MTIIGIWPMKMMVELIVIFDVDYVIKKLRIESGVYVNVGRLKVFKKYSMVN